MPRPEPRNAYRQYTGNTMQYFYYCTKQQLFVIFRFITVFLDKPYDSMLGVRFKVSEIPLCMKSNLSLLSVVLLIANTSFAQNDSTLSTRTDTLMLAGRDTALVAITKTSQVKDSSKLDKLGTKMEHLFKIIPAPILSYSTEAGQIFGLAKFNLFQLSKKDTISKASKLSEVVSFSTKGRINISVSTELIFKQNKYNVLAFINYKKQPEYIFGIGNSVSKADLEEIVSERFKFSAVGLRRIKNNFLVGLAFDYTNYFSLKTDSASFLHGNPANGIPPVTGVNGGVSTGLGLSAAYDSRDNRYNAYSGMFILTTLMLHPSFLGSDFQFTKFFLDVRKYFNPWYKHVIAVQATNTYVDGNTPFYELAQLGGDARMRGYYEGALRDNVLFDTQVEYRMPIWKIFGAAAWVGTGRVADSYRHLTLDGFRISYGVGLRFRVDTKNNTNMRLDFGFGENGIKGTYINFAEAF